MPSVFRVSLKALGFDWSDSAGSQSGPKSSLNF